MDEVTTFSDALLWRGADHDVAVVEGGVEFTYADLRHAAQRVAAELLALGLGSSDRVALLGRNSLFWMAAYLAAMKVGVVVPLSDLLQEHDLERQIEWAGCSAVLMDRRTQQRMPSLTSSVPAITDDVLSTSGELSWPNETRGPERDAALMFTSGTTARPKAVRLTHRNLVANTESIVEYLHLEPSDRMLAILPFHYVFGASLLHTHLFVGASLVLCNSFAFPETALDLVDQYSCTGIAGVPSTFQLMLRASSYATRQLRSLRAVLQAGGKLAPSLVGQLRAAQPQSQLFIMYGQTEATARLSFLPPELLDEKPGSIGHGIPGVDLQVIGPNGTPVAAGEHGEIVARGENISPGYWNDPAGTASKFVDGALHTGDIATVDEQGFIWVVGRADDFIKSWGHRFSPFAVEEAILGHPDVVGAVAIGVPDETAGEAVVLVVETVAGKRLGENDVLVFLKGQVAPYMLPRRVHQLDRLPTTSSGKVSRGAVADMIEGF